jgi:hypothetical protein
VAAFVVEVAVVGMDGVRVSAGVTGIVGALAIMTGGGREANVPASVSVAAGSGALDSALRQPAANRTVRMSQHKAIS